MDCWKSSSELKSYIITSLNQLGIKPSQQKGQNFLINSDIIKFQVAQANISTNDVILEIGGGLGNLTRCMVNNVKKMYVIEADRRLAQFLQDTYSSTSNIEIILGDAVKVDFPLFTKCISNLPYQISSPITFKLLNHSFELAILMYQKEFAQRFFAEPGSHDYSRLSVMMNLRARCKYLKTIKASSFLPPPKIQSSIVSVQKKTETLIEDEIGFSKFVTLLFSHKKKIVRSVLSNVLRRKAKQFTIPINLKIEPDRFTERRIFTLSLDELIDLYNNLKTKIGENLWLDIISQNTS
ncbi:MAG: ribosomal RNA small subunit methyltransferase A [Candidatus Heimdallarchaeota archaeon]|nr:ribosomal RNA small subunit methyltransferase A [Candidatus Heimdallarchaeota archaeon]